MASESCSVMKSLVQNRSVPREKSSNHRWITCNTKMSLNRLPARTRNDSHQVEYKILTSILTREIIQYYFGLHLDLDGAKNFFICVCDTSDLIGEWWLSNCGAVMLSPYQAPLWSPRCFSCRCCSSLDSSRWKSFLTLPTAAQERSILMLYEVKKEESGYGCCPLIWSSKHDVYTL